MLDLLLARAGRQSAQVHRKKINANKVGQTSQSDVPTSCEAVLRRSVEVGLLPQPL